MMQRINCPCGEALFVALPTATQGFSCPKCNRWVSAPSPADENTASGPTAPNHNAQPSRLAGWPVAGAAAAILLIGLALLWALMMQSGLGGGSGGIGGGIGTGTGGKGPGSGTMGSGPGDGAAGSGIGGDRPSPLAAAAPVLPRTPAAPSPAPPREETFGLTDVKKVETPVAAPPPAPAGTPGESGDSGGGSGGTAPGKDVGGRGEVSFTLVWTYTIGKQGIRGTGGPDVDLWVQDPHGQIVNTSQEGRFGLGPTPEGGRSDFDDRGGWAKDGKGGGPERIFWPKGNCPKGTFRYGVRWFRGTGAAQYTVRVYRDDAAHQTKTGTLAEASLGKNIELGTVTVP
jgi:hypothetical protein